MAGLMEKLALGEIHVRGEFEIVTKNELTGRVYQRVKEENTIHDAFYAYLRQAAIDAISNNINSIGTAPPNFGMNKTFQYCSPFNTIALTDGALASGAIDPQMGIDGTVLALGVDATSATSGTIYGTPTASEWYAHNHAVYKRWDWASANGNGTFSKILTTAGSMRTGNRFCTSIASGKDLFVKAAPSITLSGTVCGGQADDLWYVYSISTTSLTLRRIRLTASGLTQTDYTIASSSPTFTSGSFYDLYHSTLDSNVVYLVSGLYTTRYVHKINISTLTLVSNTTISTPYAKMSLGTAGYITSSDVIYMYGYTDATAHYGLHRYIYTASSATVDSGTQIASGTDWFLMPFTFTKWAYTSGNNAYLYNAVTGSISVLNISDGTHTVDYLSSASRLNTPFDVYKKHDVYVASSEGTYGLFKYNGYYYAVTYNIRAPVFQFARCIENLTPDFIVTTSKLLASTITKTSTQSMYVGYTLEFS